MGHIVGRNVRTQMMHRNERLMAGQSHSLGKINPHQQRANQPRRKGDGDAVNVAQSASRPLERERHHRRDIFLMTAGGDFGYHAAKFFMFLHLR